ncbi:hypothetical protein KCP71_25600 [Salmonella enterica subsp. enterica]|nr:hypothetical protein KCP71_25600 [Salmonella enterica subsp. enterica]
MRRERSGLHTRWVQTGGRLLRWSASACATARLTLSLAVADFPAFATFFQTGHGLFIQQRRAVNAARLSNGAIF